LTETDAVSAWGNHDERKRIREQFADIPSHETPEQLPTIHTRPHPDGEDARSARLVSGEFGRLKNQVHWGMHFSGMGRDWDEGKQ
jgi:hypothetical protein